MESWTDVFPASPPVLSRYSVTRYGVHSTHNLDDLKDPVSILSTRSPTEPVELAVRHPLQEQSMRLYFCER